MKQNYEKPLSTVVQMTTESIIATSDTIFTAAAITGPDDITNIIGDTTGEIW